MTALRTPDLLLNVVGGPSVLSAPNAELAALHVPMRRFGVTVDLSELGTKVPEPLVQEVAGLAVVTSVAHSDPRGLEYQAPTGITKIYDEISRQPHDRVSGADLRDLGVSTTIISGEEAGWQRRHDALRAEGIAVGVYVPKLNPHRLHNLLDAILKVEPGSSPSVVVSGEMPTNDLAQPYASEVRSKLDGALRENHYKPQVDLNDPNVAREYLQQRQAREAYIKSVGRDAPFPPKQISKVRNAQVNRPDIYLLGSEAAVLDFGTSYVQTVVQPHSNVIDLSERRGRRNSVEQIAAQVVAAATSFMHGHEAGVAV